MADHKMVVVNGVRYRSDEAKRRGLVPDTEQTTKQDTESKRKSSDAQHKMRKAKQGGTDDSPAAGER